MRNTGAWVVMCVLALTIVVDCGGGETCSPGDTQDCECATGAGGTRTCYEDGSDWGMCRCSDPDGGTSGNVCDDLPRACAECRDPTVRQACESAIKSVQDEGDQDKCQEWIDAWDSYKDSMCNSDGGYIGWDSGGEGECEYAGDYCPGGRCFEKVDTGDLFCAAECTTVGDACDLGGCYYTTDGPYCFEAGTKVPGETCGASAECIVGAVCLQADGPMMCWLVCAADEDCDEPAVCTDTGLGFSVCAVEE